MRPAGHIRLDRLTLLVHRVEVHFDLSVYRIKQNNPITIQAVAEDFASEAVDSLGATEQHASIDVSIQVTICCRSCSLGCCSSSDGDAVHRPEWVCLVRTPQVGRISDKAICQSRQFATCVDGSRSIAQPEIELLKFVTASPIVRIGRFDTFEDVVLLGRVKDFNARPLDQDELGISQIILNKNIARRPDDGLPKSPTVFGLQ